MVIITIHNNPTVGQPLKLKCNGTTVRGITSRVDIVWRRYNTIVNSARVTATTMDNSSVYINYYNISQLNTSDDGVIFECRLVIRGGSGVRATDAVSLDVFGMYINKTSYCVAPNFRSIKIS